MPIANTSSLALINLIRSFKRIPVEYLANSLNESSEQVREELRGLSDKNIVRLHPDTDEVELS